MADGADLRRAIELGYAGASVGTRFLATHEAQVTQSYKDAIVAATGDDIVWTNKLAGTNSSVIKTDQVAAGGLRVNALVAWLLRNRYTKTLTRTLTLMLKQRCSPWAATVSPYPFARRLKSCCKRAAFDDQVGIWQAGRGVDRIESIRSCADVLRVPMDVTSCRLELTFFRKLRVRHQPVWNAAICPNVAASSDAPPTKTPSMSLWRMRPSMTLGFTEPPYRMRHESATEGIAGRPESLPDRRVDALRDVGRADQPRADGPDRLVRDDNVRHLGRRDALERLGELQGAHVISDPQLVLLLRLADAQHRREARIQRAPDLGADRIIIIREEAIAARCGRTRHNRRAACSSASAATPRRCTPFSAKTHTSCAPKATFLLAFAATASR